MWWLYALLSSITAALVAIFGKMGLQGVDSTLATALRSIIMAVFMVLAALLLGKFNGFTFASLSGRAWLFIALAGVAGALSWLFYFMALKMGLVNKVVVIDRLSLVFVVILSAIFLGEAFTWKVALGAVLMVGGALVIALA
jgi:bacterial/archaeal transporter family protein